jgi:hypothetical protein
MQLMRGSLKIMAKQVLAIGLDPIHVDLSGHPEITAELVSTFIETQLDRVRALGCEVVNCSMGAMSRKRLPSAILRHGTSIV